MSQRFRPVCGDTSHLKILVIAVTPDLLAIDLSSTLADKTESRDGDDRPDRPSDEAPVDGTVVTFGAAVASAPALRTLTCTMPSQMPKQSVSAPLRLPPSIQPLPGAVGAVDAVHIHPVGAK
jgi:hypothetical protein